MSFRVHQCTLEAASLACGALAVRSKPDATPARACDRLGHHQVHADALLEPLTRLISGDKAAGLETRAHGRELAFLA